MSDLIKDILNVQENNTNKKIQKMLSLCGKHGVFREAIPLNLGGVGSKFEDLCTLHYKLGYETHNTNLILAINAHLWGIIFPLVFFGNKSQKRDLLPKLLNGDKIGGHAITEPMLGSDLSKIASLAVKNDFNSYTINSYKRYITNIPIADYIVVYTKLNKHITAFIINKADIGAKFIESSQVSGFGGAPIGELILTNCIINQSRMLGNPDAGARMIQKALELERAFIFAGLVGVMQWQLERVIENLNGKSIEGIPLRQFKNITHKIAEISLKIETIKLWIRKCAFIKDQGKTISLLSSYTKLYASNAFTKISLATIEILGAKGLEVKEPFANFLLDSVASKILSGTDDIQKNIIDGLIGSGKQPF